MTPDWDLSGGKDIDTDLPSSRDVFRHEAEPIELDRFDPTDDAPVWRALYVTGDDL